MTLIIPRKFEPKKFSGAPFGVQTVRYSNAVLLSVSLTKIYVDDIRWAILAMGGYCFGEIDNIDDVTVMDLQW